MRSDIKHRKFGIELEISRQFVNASNDERCKNENWGLLQNAVENARRKHGLSAGWKVKTDTSCGGEIVSPILEGQAGLREIALISEAAVSCATERKRPVVDGECGLHLHFDASDISAPQIGRIFALLQVAEVIIFGMYPYRNFKYCSPITINMRQPTRWRDMIDVRNDWYRGSNNIKKPETVYPSSFVNSTTPGDHYDGTRYHGFNIHCFWHINTVEFRYAPGTFNFMHIAAYYELCLSIINTAMDKNASITVPKELQSSNWPQVVSLYSKGYRRRSLIAETMKRLKLSRQTCAFMLSEFRNRNKSFLERDPDTITTWIVKSNSAKFIFRSEATGNCYNFDGTRTSNIAGRQMVSCAERIDGGILTLVPVKPNIKVSPIRIGAKRKIVVSKGGFWIDRAQAPAPFEVEIT